jgi:1-acyl-sn-glycerol-3-phosphate acyltransferase
MIRLLRWLYFKVFVQTVILFILGLNIRHRDRLPQQGPAILIANHNSHLDTMVLMTILPWRILDKVRPVAAMDYFFRNRLLAWFATNIIGILPIARKRNSPNDDPLAGCRQALTSGEILILFPEGSRGEPEQLSGFKTGVARLAESQPHVPFIPIYMHRLGKALPRGEALLVPFICDIFVGDPLAWHGDKDAYMKELDKTMRQLAEEGHFPTWQ